MSFYDLRKVTVLIVEDSGFMAKLLKTILRGLAVGTVHECLRPAEVLDYVREFQPDIIFLDKDMPQLDGLAVAREIRRNEESPNPFMPIIMVTAHTKKVDVMAARDAGVTEFLAKPVSAKSVYDHLAACIEAPRPFVKTKGFHGPDRRRHASEGYDGPDRRRRGPRASKVANAEAPEMTEASNQ